EKFEEDDLWERLGRKRLYSKPTGGNYAVVDDGLWSFLTGKIDRQLAGLLADPDTLSRKSLFVEFSRGKEHGYSEALSQLSEEILSRAAILYICVSFEESYRKNLIRYDEKKRDGILTHSVPHGEMKQTYRDDDWFDLTSTPHGTLDVNGIPVPYVTMKNEPESTDLDVLDARYKDALDRLYVLWRESRK
ncbi:hypothetical protein KAX14_00640, partial [Candidatus Bipolaricaulota bacterium]|nr:hypothetical protein [Candidatus Bipolaricaulota bacterium]